jgi:surface polysaccharide O-acyltransferase-like enzyme
VTNLRNNTIDLFRLLAVFSVITLHVGYYESIPQIYGEIIRLSGRWAVPFFFLVTGAFIALNKKENDCNKQAFRILKIFLISSLIFLPYSIFINDEYINTISLLKLTQSGTFFHLWFLSSLTIGLLAFGFFNKHFKILIIPTSIFLLFLFACVDIYTYKDNVSSDTLEKLHSLTRHATSFSFISIGYILVNKNIVHKIPLSITGIFITIVLFILSFIEPYVIFQITGSEVIQRQFPILTPIIAILFLIFCFQVKINNNFISAAGKKYSLGIYIVHPIFIAIFTKLFSNVYVGSNIISVIMTFISSWLLIAFFEKNTPRFFNILNGK